MTDDNNTDIFLTALREGSPAIDPATAARLIKAHPFFTLPALMALKHSDTSADDRRQLMTTLAINAGDRAQLMKLVDSDSREWLDFYPPQPDPTKNTIDTIDTFLETYGHTNPEEDALLERLIFNPTPDYSSVLEQEQAGSGDSIPATPTGDDQIDRINSFIAKNREKEGIITPVATPVAAAPKPQKPAHAHKNHAPEPEPDTPLAESLARIYIKQKKYDKAYELLSKLNESHTGRRRYYADSLRFLGKVMALQNRKS